MEQLLNYIRQQPESVVLDIIQDEDACRTYIKLLPPMSQQILFRLLLIPNGFPVTEIRKWSNNESIVNCTNELIVSHLVQYFQDPSNHTFIKIMPLVREVLMGQRQKPEGGFHQSVKVENPFLQPQNSIFGTPTIKKELSSDFGDCPNVPESILDEFSKDQLYNILSYMLQLTQEIDDEARKILYDSGLMEFGGTLTTDGHRFLLMNPKEQIWRIVQTYLNNTKDLISSIRFILQIGSMQLTHGYPISKLPNFLETLIHPFRAIGLVYIQNGYFYPTKSILNFFGRSDIFKSEGWLFMDTNFKITAFPRNELQTNLLKKFAIITYEFPGFTSAFISPNSFRSALNDGTTLDDIITFLRSNLSKTIGSGKIPDNVEKQLHVWRDERDRTKVYGNATMRQYHDRKEAEIAAQIARDMNGLIFGPYYREQFQSYVVITDKDIDASYSQEINNIDVSEGYGAYSSYSGY